MTITGLTHSLLGDVIATLSHGNKTVDILDRVRGGGDFKYGSHTHLNGDYTFVTTGGADFDAYAVPREPTGTMPTDVDYATVPVGNTSPFGGVSDANGLLSDFQGMSVSGTWSLNISDRISSFSGSFTGWKFEVGDPSQINTITTISDALFNVLPNVRVGNTSSTDVTLAVGAVVQNMQAVNGSRIFMNAGNAVSLRAQNTAKLYVNSGTISGAVTATDSGTAFINGGTVSGAVTAQANSTVFVNGGTVGSVVTTDSAHAYVAGGTFRDLSASGSSEIWVYGGNISRDTLYAYGNGAYNLFGTNLALDFASAVTGLDAIGLTSGTYYNLTGTLSDGTRLDTRFFDADGGYGFGQGTSRSPLFFNGVAVTVPEAGSLPLVLAGVALFGMVVIRRRK